MFVMTVILSFTSNFSTQSVANGRLFGIMTTQPIYITAESFKKAMINCRNTSKAFKIGWLDRKEIGRPI